MSPLRVVAFPRLIAAFGLFLCCGFAHGQAPPRVSDPVDDSKRVTLTGNVHPMTRTAVDQGVAPGSLPMKRMLLLLNRTDQQETALQTLLEQMQQKSSPNYHRWLTPAEFGAQFGPADADVQAVSGWLTSHGFTVDKVYSGKTVIEFSGTAGQVQEAFGTAIHTYTAGGKTYTGNSSDPQIPAALAPVVSGVVSLYNFPRDSHVRNAGVFQMRRNHETPGPLYTSQDGHYPLAPADFATIYNTQPLLTAGNDGTGQTIAIVGETDINVSDVQAFRSLFSLPANFTSSNVVVNGEDPGITSRGEETESDLDVQWSGAVAPGATVKFVTSSSTASTAGIDLSALYIIENNLAGVMSESYGQCEAALGTAGNAFYNKLWQQAAAQGITVILSAGDGGSAGCDNFDTELVATKGIAVSGLASTPYNLALGGTDFDQLNKWQLYWSGTNSATYESALGYIPETTWNDSCAYGGLAGCSEGGDGIVAGSGGPSTIYAKPSWQVGTNGMPNDNHRDLPDVSLFASNDFTGSSYIVCQADAVFSGSACTNLNSEGYTYIGVGGTSASAPAFAGIMALVEQKTGSRQGNANEVLYQLVKKAGATCNASTALLTGNLCAFYDVTKGNNSVPCAGGGATSNCSVATGTGVLVDSKGNLAWNTTPGYDQATGLGSVNATNLANAWNSVATVATTTTLSLSPTNNIKHGTEEGVHVNISVSPTSGTASGNVSLIATINNSQRGVDQFALTNGSASGTTANLPGGTYSVHAHYSGDGTNAPSDSAPVQVTVNPESSQTFIVVPLYDPSTGHLISGNASSVPYGGIYRIRMYVTNSSAAGSATGPPSPTCDAVDIYTCPTGTITLTANGQPVDRAGGIYQLNDVGYTRDINPTLGGANYTLQAQYSGDSSYTANSTTAALAVTPAVTTTQLAGGGGFVVAGTAFSLSETVSANSLGNAETGTITLSDGGAPVSGAITTTNGQTGVGFPVQALLQGNTTLTLTTPGIHTLTAQYSGDANYTASTSSPTTVTVLNPTTTSLAASSLNIVYGNTITLTATVNTTVKSPTPTQNVMFYGGQEGFFSGQPTYKTTTDSQGNVVLQASLVVTPVNSEVLWATFAGDSNFASSSSNSTPLNLTVVTPDFSLNPAQVSLTIPAGQTASVPITVTPASNLSSQVQFDLSRLSTPGLGCQISPSAVSLSGQQAATTTFSCTVPAPSATTMAAVSLPIDEHGPYYRGPWAVAAAFALFAVCLLSLLKNGSRFAFASFVMAVILVDLGCGGGSSGGGGGGGGGGGPTPTSVSFTVPATKVSNQSSFVATVTVAGTSSPTGQVSIQDTVSGQTWVGILAAGQAQVTVFLQYPGGHALVAQYSGDLHNIGSQTKTPLEVVATGTTNSQFSASTGSDVKTIQVVLTVQ